MNSVKISMSRIKLFLAVPFNTYNQMLERRPLLTKSVTTGVMYCIGDIIAQSLEKNINASNNSSSSSKCNENSTNNSSQNENDNSTIIKQTTASVDETAESHRTSTTTPSISTHHPHPHHTQSPPHIGSSGSSSDDGATTQSTGWIDARRAGIFLVFGTLISGPLYHYWYNCLNEIPGWLYEIKDRRQRFKILRAQTYLKSFGIEVNIKKLPAALKLSKWTKKIIKIAADQLIFSSCYLFIFFMGIGILQGLVNKYDEIQDINNNMMMMINSEKMNVRDSSSSTSSSSGRHDGSSSSSNESGGGIDKIHHHHDTDSSVSNTIIYDNFNHIDSQNNNNNNNTNNNDTYNIDSNQHHQQQQQQQQYQGQKHHYDANNEYIRMLNLINDLKPLINRLEDQLMTKHDHGGSSSSSNSNNDNNSNNNNSSSNNNDNNNGNDNISSVTDMNASNDRSSSRNSSISSNKKSVSTFDDNHDTHSEPSIDTGNNDDSDDNNNTDESESLPISLHILKSIREKLHLYESSKQQHHQQQQQSVYQHEQSHHLLSSQLPPSPHPHQLPTTTRITPSSTTPLTPQLLSLFDTNILSEVIRNAWKHTIDVYLMTYLSDSIVWPPLQLINFSFVPVRYQFLYVNTCNLFWNTFLSYVANKK